MKVLAIMFFLNLGLFVCSNAQNKENPLNIPMDNIIQKQLIAPLDSGNLNFKKSDNSILKINIEKKSAASSIEIPNAYTKGSALQRNDDSIILNKNLSADKLVPMPGTEKLDKNNKELKTMNFQFLPNKVEVKPKKP